MHRAGYSSRCVCWCVCHGAALADETFSTIETDICSYKVGDDQREADFWIGVLLSKLGKQHKAALDI